MGISHILSTRLPFNFNMYDITFSLRHQLSLLDYLTLGIKPVSLSLNCKRRAAYRVII